MLNVVDRMPGKDLAELAPVAVFERIFIVASVVCLFFCDASFRQRASTSALAGNKRPERSRRFAKMGETQDAYRL
jgi:hypothetical protein